MPRISGIPGPYWFYFYSFDCNEPMHVHVRRDRQHAKFWLAPVSVAWNEGFSPRELKARIKSVLRRRAPESAQEALRVGTLELDPVTHRTTAGGAPVALGPTEFRLLKFLMARPERVHSRSQLLDQVWGDHVYIEERTVDVHIRRLRLALEPAGHEQMIETVRGSGYRLAAPSGPK